MRPHRRRANPSDGRRWRGLMPTIKLARDQIHWERRHALLRAHEAGATLPNLAAWLGEPWSFVAILIDRARRERRAGARSPAEHWIASGEAELRQAASHMVAAEMIAELLVLVALGVLWPLRWLYAFPLVVLLVWWLAQ